MKQKIFLAGHRGMVGSAVRKVLSIQKELELVVKDRKELDLTHQNSVFDFFKNTKIDIVILAAAKVGGIMANIESPAEFLYINLQIQNNIYEAARMYGVKKIVFLGSSCIYPKNCPQPMKEEYLLSGPLESTNEGYALAKITGLKMAELYKKQYGINSISLMPCNLYGKNDSFDPQHSHVLSALVKKFYDAREDSQKAVTLWGTGIAEREFLNVQDLAKVINYLLINDVEVTDDFLNVGTGKSISIKDLALLIQKLVGFKGEILWDKSKPDGMLKKCLDITKFSKLYREEMITLQDGVKEMIANYQKIRESK